MPRAPRIRKREPMITPSVTPPAREPMSPERRQWLSYWKDRAIGRLPLTAPVNVKVQLRREVEEALRAYGPGDSSAEVEDIITVRVQHTRDQLERATTDQQRAEQKTVLLALADVVLEIAIGRCPLHLVGPPRSAQRQHIIRTLRPKLRSALELTLTGDESVFQVFQEITDWVAAWQAEQGPEPWHKAAIRKASRAAKGTAMLVDAAMKVPECKKIFETGASLVGARLADMLQRKFLAPPSAKD